MPATPAGTGLVPESALGSVELGSIELAIGGMTCSSCAARIEKKLNRLPGVTATVNYATEKAKVTFDGSVSDADMIATVEATGYTATLPAAPAEQDNEAGTESSEPDDEVAALRQRLIISTILAVPVLLMAMVPPLQFTNWQWLSLTLASPVVVWGALPFHRAAWANARHGAATMDTLISVGVSAAFLWSLWALFFGTAGTPGATMSFHLLPSRGEGMDELYLEVAAVVTVFILAGRYFEARAKKRSSAALRALLSLGAKDVAVLRETPNGRQEVRIGIAELVAGDLFVVRPGEKVATDGIVVEGTSAIDASMLTGESVPVEVGVDSPVVGATTNVGGRIVVQATRVGADTQLAQMARLVEDAQNGKAPVQRLADRISAIFVPVVILLSLSTLSVWLLTGHSAQQAFTAAVAVLIIACPCALGLATPTALLVGTGRGAQLGILIKGPQVLESTRTVDTIVLDKTGTVTTGRMSLHEVIAAPDEDADEILAFAGAVEDASEHPIAAAIAAAARSAHVVDLTARAAPQPGVTPPGSRTAGSLLAVTDFANAAGQGVRGTVDGRVVWSGRASWVAAQVNRDLPAELSEQITVAESAGRTVVAAGWDGAVRGALVVSDTVKPTSAQAITELRSLGLRPVLLTGDNARAAAAIAAEVGIDEVIAEVLPAQKVSVVRDLQAQGRVVAMVGDGVNDAAALAAADLGLAMGTGTDVAIEASDLTLVRGDLRTAADAIRLSRSTLRTIKGNLFWAFAYNVAALPLAALGLLNPLIAGAAMAFSSVFVVSNSLRLRRFRSWAA